MDLLDDLAENEWLSMEASEESESQFNYDKLDLPFDPRLIKITIETSTIFGLAQRLKHKYIDLYPDFQRKANLWDAGKQSRLVESLLLRFPLPAFYFDIENEDKWLVVDGLQRLSTLRNFIVETDNPLKLVELEILKDLTGKQFKELDITLRRRILETNVTTFQIQAGTPKKVKYNVFKRINTGGLGLNNMEIRHALNQEGYANRFLKDLTDNEDSFFNHFITENKIKSLRMEDRELALRYIAFYGLDYKEYEPSLTIFLDKAIEELDKKTKQECIKLGQKLEKAIDCYESIFGNTRFGRGLTRRARLNSALFEAWTSELAKLSDAKRETLVYYREYIKIDYKELLENEDFNKSISRSTSNKNAVMTRFKEIGKLIKKHTK